jgi:hypothetical protein
MFQGEIRGAETRCNWKTGVDSHTDQLATERSGESLDLKSQEGAQVLRTVHIRVGIEGFNDTLDTGKDALDYAHQSRHVVVATCVVFQSSEGANNGYQEGAKAYGSKRVGCRSVKGIPQGRRKVFISFGRNKPPRADDTLPKQKHILMRT